MQAKLVVLKKSNSACRQPYHTVGSLTHFLDIALQIGKLILPHESFFT